MRFYTHALNGCKEVWIRLSIDSDMLVRLNEVRALQLSGPAERHHLSPATT